MAMIPSNVKTSKTLDTGGMLEKLIIVMIAVVMVDTMVTPYVHKALSPLVYIVTAVLVLYLILPNNKNHGTSGYMRLLLVVKYYVYKIRDKVVKNQ